MTVIVDTGVFFGFYSLRDEHHLDSVALLVHLAEGRWGRGFITNHILDETLNILKYRVSGDSARAFIEAFIDSGVVKVVYTDEGVESRALSLYVQNLRRKGFSYTDAVTVVVMEEYGIGYLLSYDMRSFSGLVNNIVGPGYWESLSGEERSRIMRLVDRVLPRAPQGF